MPRKYNTALDFVDKESGVRVYPGMHSKDFAKLSPALKKELVGKKPKESKEPKTKKK